MVPCFPLLGLTPSGLFMGLISTLIYTSELILCSTNGDVLLFSVLCLLPEVRAKIVKCKLALDQSVLSTLHRGGEGQNGEKRKFPTLEV